MIILWGKRENWDIGGSNPDSNTIGSKSVTYIPVSTLIYKGSTSGSTISYRQEDRVHQGFSGV